MSSRYDSRTTTFSPEGRLYQVEYAVEATTHAGTAIGLCTKDGIVLAAEKRLQNVLLDVEATSDRTINGDKLHTIDSHLGCAIAGITSDANALIKFLRGRAHGHRFFYGEPMVCEEFCRVLCDLKQEYTQHGGVRPYGVSFLLAGWDKYEGFQLYHTDPSGNYSGWKAFAIGANEEAALGLLRQEWREGMTLREGQLLAAKVLAKTMDVIGLTVERMELATLVLGPARPALPRVTPHKATLNDVRVPTFSVMQAADLAPILAEAEDLRRLAEEEAKKKEAQASKKGSSEKS